MHRRDPDIRYPNIRRTSDTEYLNDWRQKRAAILPREASYLYLQYSHGGNLWGTDHFLRRVRNTPKDLLPYAWHRYVRGNLFGPRAFSSRTGCGAPSCATWRIRCGSVFLRQRLSGRNGGAPGRRVRSVRVWLGGTTRRQA